MKTLLILRHAKSGYPAGVARDFDRPLAQRGVKEAPVVGRLLRASGPVPERIVSSPALRARQTAEAVAAELGLGARALCFEDRLYAAAPETLSAVAAGLAASLGVVLFVGHNPGLEEWVGRLCGARVRLRTAALAQIDLPTDRWTDVESASGQLQWLVVPRLLEALR
ncbi:MAG: histidine phosphatase family protein [Candidatus Latescibacterota bacterium]